MRALAPRSCRPATRSSSARRCWRRGPTCAGCRFDGSDLEGIHYLRALGNADALRADVADAERVAIVGGSYIGTEVAASMTAMGKQAVIVMQEGVVHEHGFGPIAGAFFQKVLEDHGVEIHAGEGLERFEGEGQRVERLVCASGLVVECDAVVLGVARGPT